VPSTRARAFWVVTPGQGEIRDEPLADPQAGDAIVRARFSGISRGTETLVFNGAVPESEWQRMRAPFQGGSFPAPVKYGYCSVGEVEDGPADLAEQRVFCLYPHQTRYAVPASALHVIPRDVPAGRAVLAANMETAINGVWDGSVQPGDRVAVVGAGAVGCLIAYLAGRIPGSEVCLIDVNQDRAAVAASLGIDFALPDVAPADCDVVFHASGSPQGLQRALTLGGFEATVIEMSWFGTRSVELSLGGAFHAQRLTVRSSQVGHVATSHRSRWDYRRRMQLALSLLVDPVLDARGPGESSFDDLPEVMRELATGRRDGLCHRVRYDTDAHRGVPRPSAD
jgi:NADPH:quinone reductase-like Zn-dependent oxidoreductase